MKSLDFLKKLPTPARMVFRPMLMMSLVLHGVVLMLPISLDIKKSELPKKEATVKITKLALAVKSSSQIAPQSSLKPTLQLNPHERQINLRPTFQERQVNLPVTPQERQVNSPKIIVTRPVPQTNPSPSQSINQKLANSDTSKTKELQENSTTSKESTQTSQDSTQRSQDSTQKSKESTQTSQDSTQEPTVPQKIINFFATFPRYPGAEKGSGGVLRPDFENATYIFHTDNNLENVAAKFEKELLPTENFTRPKLIHNEDDFKTYEVSNSTGTETNYLHLIFKYNKTAIYLEKQNYTLAQLINEQTEERKNQLLGGYIVAVIEGIKPQYKLDNFNPANDFDRLDEKDKFKAQKFDLKHAKKTTGDNPVSEEKLISSLETQLKLLNFDSLSPEGKYGTSTVYKAKQGTSETYLVLAPAKDEQGKPITVIILSEEKPS
ncbi:MAG TPA: hypothetical protein V6D26_20780 [Stenomitos sp.]